MGFQIKIVGDFCNIRCSYCRNRDFNQTGKVAMSIETLEKLFVFLSSLPQKKIRVNWHGGEPLLAGKIFFNHIVRLEKKYTDKTWLNIVQTNATLIDNDWAKFFFNNDFHLGVSVDGTEQINDINRINIIGHGTYKKAIRGVEILRLHGIYPGVICTITKKTVSRAREIFFGLISASFKNIAFNAFYNTASENTMDEYGLTEKDWYHFLKEIFEAWTEINDKTISVRELDAILAWTTGVSTNDCSFRGTCNQWFAIGYTGDIYPCERLGNKIHFGNIDSTASYENLITSRAFLDWKDSIKILPNKCKTCAFLSLCHNGCSAHRQDDDDGRSIYVYCESRLGFYNYVNHKLKGGRL